jgi:ferric-dicitrate binding protein FerR (iron transport regulator)
LVGDDTEIVLALKGETFIHLDENSEMVVSHLEENQSGGFLSRLRLLTGAILSDVKKKLSESQSSFEVDSGGVVCAVRGTLFEVVSEGGRILTSADQGRVEVRTSQGTLQVSAGETCSASRDQAPSARPSSKAIKARFQTWRRISQRFRGQKGKADHPGAPRLGNGTRLGPRSAQRTGPH